MISDQVVLSIQVLKSSREGNCTTHLGNLLQCSPVLLWKKLFSSLEVLSYQFSPVVSHPPTTHHCEEPFCLLSNLPARMGRQLGGPPRFLFPSLKKLHSLIISPQGRFSSSELSSSPSPELVPFDKYCTEEPKTGCSIEIWV